MQEPATLRARFDPTLSEGSRPNFHTPCRILDLIRRTASARAALPFLANDGLGLVRAVKPCASRTALRLRGLTARPAQAGGAFMWNARACDASGKIQSDTVRRVISELSQLTRGFQSRRRGTTARARILGACPV